MPAKGRTPRSRIVTKYTDISNAPIEADDILVLWNEKEEHEYVFRVVTVIDDPSNATKRKLNLTLVDCTDPEKTLMTDYPITIDRNENVQGAIIKKNAAEEGLSNVDLERVLVIEIYKFLTKREAHNYGAKWKVVVQFLLMMKLLKPEQDYQVHKKIVAKAIAPYQKQLFNSHSGYLYWNGKDVREVMDTSAGFNTAGVAGVGVVKVVKLSHITLAIRMLLESGLFGDVQIEE